MRKPLPTIEMLRIVAKLRRWWNPLRAPEPGPRRVKNYAAATGFQYSYQLRTSAPGDYEFAIWTGALPVFLMRITVPLPSVAARDRYALAKLRLFHSFDEYTPESLPALQVVSDTAALDQLQA